MDPATIQQIAAEVARHLPSYAWPVLLVQVLLTLLAAAAGAFFGEYLKTRGKNLATKADFESLKDQLRANTELVETIKAEVGQKDWAAREWTNLRRVKLEALVEKMHECDAALEQYGSRCMEGSAKDHDNRDLPKELRAIGNLYFPELESEVSRFCVSSRQQSIRGLELAKELVFVGKDTLAGANAIETFGREWLELYKEHAAARTALTTAARRLLVSIMGVEEGSRDNHSEAPTETH